MRLERRLILLVVSVLVCGLLGWAAPAGAQVPEIVVVPSGDLSGAQDWANLTHAFNTAGSGATVRLAQGKFYVNQTVDVVDFAGTFAGSGAKASVLSDAPSALFQGYAFRGEERPALMLFRYEALGDGSPVPLTLENLVVESSQPLKVAGIDVMGFWREVEASEPVSLPIMSMDLTWRNMDFRGIRGNFVMNETTVVDSDGGFVDWYWSYLKGTFIFEDCHFEDTEFGWITWGAVDSDVRFTRVTADNVDFSVTVVGDASRSDIEWSEIRSVASGLAVWIRSGFQAFWIPETMPDPSIYEIRDSEIETDFYGIYLADHANEVLGVPTIRSVDILSNTITTVPGVLAVVPILGRAVADVFVAGNLISGNYRGGVNPWRGSNDWRIRDNLFQDLHSLHGAIAIEDSVDTHVYANRFVNVSGPRGAIWVAGSRSTIGDNDFTASGLPGWSADPETSGAILLVGDENLVAQEASTFPAGTSVCDQVLDLGVANLVLGSEACRGPLLTEELIEQVQGLDLKRGITQSLTAKLSNAASAMERGNYTAAANQLRAFINEVEAQSGNAIPPATAEELIAAAEAIISALE